MGYSLTQHAGAVCLLMDTNRVDPNMKWNAYRRQQGTVLAVVLIVLVVMMLGSVSLMRSIDTSALLTGNIGFKRDSVNTAAAGLNKAFEKMKLPAFTANQESVAGCPPPAGTGTGCSAVTEWVKLNFYPRALESDSNGIPVVLKDKASFDAKFKAGTLTINGNEVRYLIERMCNRYGPSDKNVCVLDEYSSPGTPAQDLNKAGSIASPVYRVTVRTDGIRNTQTYAQWMVSYRKLQ